MPFKKSGLGRGLDALFADNDTVSSSGSLMTLRISDIEPNTEQPRNIFEQEPLEDLAASIREHGVLQPITVRALPRGGYQIIAGERRWRASRMAGLSEVPAIVIDADDNKVVELSLIENLQRENLSPLETARGYRTLIDRCALTQEQAAQRMGKSRSAVANSLRLLTLSAPVQKMIEDGLISAGHAKVLVSIDDAGEAEAMARRIVKDGLSVRQTERLAKNSRGGSRDRSQDNLSSASPPLKSSWGDSYYKEIELSLSESMGRRVKITGSSSGGNIEIQFFSKEDLTDIAQKLGK